MSTLKTESDHGKHYRDILESIYDGYYEVDASGRLMLLNTSLCEILGLPESELIGHRYLQHLSLGEMKSLYRLFLQVWTFGNSVRAREFSFRRPDGKQFTLEASATLVTDASGYPIGMRGIIRNISERKRAEQAQRESEQRYRSLFEQNGEAVVQIDLQGKVVDANPQTFSITGYQLEDIRGYRFARFLNADSRVKVRQALTHALAGLSKEYEVKVRHRTGRWILAQVKTAAIVIDERVTGFYAIFKDITEQRKSDDFLIRSEKLSMVGQLAAGIAHEIRNPLTALKGFLQLVAQNSGETRKFIEIMHAELNRIENITNELLAYSRPRQKTVFQRVQVSDLIESVRTLLSSQALMQGTVIDVRLGHGTGELFCEADQIRQVLVNLLKNAFDAACDEGRVCIETWIEHEMVCISIQDFGAGMDAETLSRLGEPFYTTKANGTGLGIMVCQRIIEAHQGSIKWESQAGKGTTVRIRLPLYISGRSEVAL